MRTYSWPGHISAGRVSRYTNQFGWVLASMALTRKTLETKDHILCTEYLGWQRTMVIVFDVPINILVENIIAYMLHAVQRYFSARLTIVC